MITKSTFGTTKDGQEVLLYRLENKNGAYVTVITYGCRIVSLCVPDDMGILTDVVLGYDTLAEYEADAASFGAVVGRHANRIGKGQFTLNGKTYNLVINNGPNHLHGGTRGYHHYNWASEVVDDTLKLTHVSPDGDEGYPGTLTMTVVYSWSDDNVLTIDYTAVSDQDTVFNTTNHSYFNLEGEHSPSVLDHVLTVAADAYTEADENTLTTGVIADVAGTPFDFRTGKTIGQDIKLAHPQLKYTKTYDHNFVLNGEGFRTAAVLYAPRTGIQMICCTDQPGMQLYVPAQDPAPTGKGGKVYPAYGSACLETQHYPNAMEHTHFPSVVLKANEPFVSRTTYSFTTVEA